MERIIWIIGWEWNLLQPRLNAVLKLTFEKFYKLHYHIYLFSIRRKVIVNVERKKVLFPTTVNKLQAAAVEETISSSHSATNTGSCKEKSAWNFLLWAPETSYFLAVQWVGLKQGFLNLCLRLLFDHYPGDYWGKHRKPVQFLILSAVTAAKRNVLPELFIKTSISSSWQQKLAILLQPRDTKSFENHFCRALAVLKIFLRTLFSVKISLSIVPY